MVNVRPFVVNVGNAYRGSTRSSGASDLGRKPRLEYGLEMENTATYRSSGNLFNDDSLLLVIVNDNRSARHRFGLSKIVNTALIDIMSEKGVDRK